MKNQLWTKLKTSPAITQFRPKSHDLNFGDATSEHLLIRVKNLNDLSFKRCAVNRFVSLPPLHNFALFSRNKSHSYTHNLQPLCLIVIVRII